MTEESAEFNLSRLKIEIQLKLWQKSRFESEIFRIFEEKIALLRCEMIENLPK